MLKEPMNCGTKVLKFTVLGDAVGQGRPRFTTINGHPKAYDTKQSREEKAAIRLIAQQAIKEQHWAFPSQDMPVKVEIVSYRQAPRSTQRWLAEAGIGGEVVPLTKPDVDNVVKLYLDAMNGVVFPDDKQVFEINIRKAYGAEPRAEVTVTGYYLNLGEIKSVANARLKRKRELENG